MFGERSFSICAPKLWNALDLNVTSAVTVIAFRSRLKTYLYDKAFPFGEMGYASAMAWIQLLIVMAFTGVIFLSSKKLVHYRGV